MSVAVSARTRVILWDAHAWAGAVASMVLYCAFFLGAFALYWEDLGPWQEPARRQGAWASVDARLVAAQGEVDRVSRSEPGWLSVEVASEHERWVKIRSSERTVWVDPSTRRAAEPTSELGEFLYRMHYLDAVPFGISLAGLASVVLLFVVATGVVMQLGKIGRELLRFRPAHAARAVWSDAHKVTGVVLIPFLVVFAWSGAVMCLSYDALRSLTTRVVHRGDEAGLNVAEGWREPPPRDGRSETAPNLLAAVRLARQALPSRAGGRDPNPGVRLGRIVVRNAGARNAAVDVELDTGVGLHPDAVVRIAPGGVVAFTEPAEGVSTYARLMNAFYGLHFASYAETALRATYAGLALLAAFSILTGNLVWIERRRRAGLRVGDRVLAKLTVAGTAGLVFAVGVIFVANQVLPRSLAGRIGWEQVAFFVAWGASLLLAIAHRSAPRASARLLLASAALFSGTLVLDAAREGRMPFDPASAVFGVQVGLASTALLVGFASRVVLRLASRSPIPAADPRIARMAEG